MFILKFLVLSNRFLCIVINNEESPHLTTSHDNELLLCIFLSKLIYELFYLVYARV